MTHCNAIGYGVMISILQFNFFVEHIFESFFTFGTVLFRKKNNNEASDARPERQAYPMNPTGKGCTVLYRNINENKAFEVGDRPDRVLWGVLSWGRGFSGDRKFKA